MMCWKQCFVLVCNINAQRLTAISICSSPPSITTGRISRMQQVMQTLESVTYYRMRLVKSLYDKLGTLAAPSIASFTACDKPRNLSAQCVCPETAGTTLLERFVNNRARHRLVAVSSRRTDENVASRSGSGGIVGEPHEREHCHLVCHKFSL